MASSIINHRKAAKSESGGSSINVAWRKPCLAWRNGGARLGIESGIIESVSAAKARAESVLGAKARRKSNNAESTVVASGVIWLRRLAREISWLNRRLRQRLWRQ